MRLKERNRRCDRERARACRASADSTTASPNHFCTSTKKPCRLGWRTLKRQPPPLRREKRHRRARHTGRAKSRPALTNAPRGNFPPSRAIVRPFRQQCRPTTPLLTSSSLPLKLQRHGSHGSSLGLSNSRAREGAGPQKTLSFRLQKFLSAEKHTLFPRMPHKRCTDGQTFFAMFHATRHALSSARPKTTASRFHTDSIRVESVD